MESKLYHCWYSAQQAELPSVAINQYRLTTGEIVTVTKISQSEKCPNFWPDCEYLGQTMYPDGHVKTVRKPEQFDIPGMGGRVRGA